MVAIKVMRKDNPALLPLLRGQSASKLYVRRGRSMVTITSWQRQPSPLLCRKSSTSCGRSATRTSRGRTTSTTPPTRSASSRVSPVAGRSPAARGPTRPPAPLPELINGGELFDKMQEKQRFDEAKCRGLFRQICSAVAYVHGRGGALRPSRVP